VSAKKFQHLAYVGKSENAALLLFSVRNEKRPRVSPEPLRCCAYGCSSSAPTSHIVPASVQVSYRKQYGNVPIS
jgi:hypothetical protein